MTASSRSTITYRLMLAALNDDEDSYDELLAEVEDPEYARFVIAKLVDGLMWEMIRRQRTLAPLSDSRELACREVERLLVERLDAEGPPRN